MILKLINNKLETLDHRLIFQTLKDTIGLVGALPISSVVKCHINGIESDYSFYLPFEKITDDGCVFSSPLILPDKILREIAEQKINISVSFSCNGIPINGTCLALFNTDYMLLEKPNEEKSLQKQLNELAEAVHKGVNHPIIGRGAVTKGMVPIAVDNFGNYSWGFINKDFELALVNVTQTLQELTKLNNNIVERVCVLEDKVILEKYDEYNIQ